MLIKEWEWDYRSLGIYNSWYYEDRIQFVPIAFEFSDNHVAVTLFSFVICYNWD